MCGCSKGEGKLRGGKNSVEGRKGKKGRKEWKKKNGGGSKKIRKGMKSVIGKLESLKRKKNFFNQEKVWRSKDVRS